MVRLSIVKGDSYVEIVSQLLCEGKKEGGEKGFVAILPTRKIHSLLKNVSSGGAHQKWNYYGDRVSRLSFVLALTIYSFHLLLFSNITPQVSITKAAAISKNRDVSYVLERKAGQQATCCLSSPPAASGRCLWFVKSLTLLPLFSLLSLFTLTLINRGSFTSSSLTGFHFCFAHYQGSKRLELRN